MLRGKGCFVLLLHGPKTKKTAYVSTLLYTLYSEDTVSEYLLLMK